MVVAVNSLALDERVEKLKTQYFSEGNDKPLDEKGKSHLYSLLDDFGYEKTNGIFCRTHNNSVDMFIERNLREKKEGFTYLCLTSPKETLEFREKYSQYLDEENNRFVNALGLGMLGGLVWGATSLAPSIETYEEIKEALYPFRESAYQGYSRLLEGNFTAETSFWLMLGLPTVIGMMIGLINSSDWEHNKKKNDKEFHERYLTTDKKYVTGKQAVESALSNSS